MEYTQTERGIFNLVGQVAHWLFEMLDCVSELVYNQITQPEEELME